MKIEVIETMDFSELIPSVKATTLYHGDEDHSDGKTIFPYRDAKVSFHSVDPDMLCSALPGLRQLKLDQQKELMLLLQKKLGYDQLNLQKIVRFRVFNERGEASEHMLTPPIVEQCDVTVTFVPTKNAPKQHDSDVRFGIPQLVDGVHRVYLARQLGRPITIMWVNSVDQRYPFYSYPLHWDDAKVYEEHEIDSKPDRLTKTEDRYRLYRTFGMQGTGAARYTQEKFYFLQNVPVNDIVIGFDLDQTLYPDTDDIRNAIRRKMYQALADHKKISFEEGKRLFEDRYSALKSGKRIFNEQGMNGIQIVHDILNTTDVTPFIERNDVLVQQLRELQKICPVYLLSSSPKTIGTQKLLKLGFCTDDFTKIIWGDSGYGLKRDGEPFQSIQEICPNKTYVFIGDKEIADTIPPKKLGWFTVYVWGNSKEANESYDNIDGCVASLLHRLSVKVDATKKLIKQ